MTGRFVQNKRYYAQAMHVPESWKAPSDPAFLDWAKDVHEFFAFCGKHGLYVEFDASLYHRSNGFLVGETDHERGSKARPGDWLVIHSEEREVDEPCYELLSQKMFESTYEEADSNVPRPE